MLNRMRTIVRQRSVGIILILLAFSYCARGEGQLRDLTKAKDSLAESASRFFGEGKYRKALDLMALNDTTLLSSRLFYYCGMSSAALYDYQKAQEYFKKAIDQDSTNVYYHFQFGRLLTQAGFAAEAIDEFKLCFALDSSYLPASFQLGLIYNVQKKDPKEEVEIFSFLIRQNPSDFLSLYYKGDALKRQGLADSGVNFVLKSIELNPQYVPSLLSYANYRNSKKEYAIALKYYQEASIIRPHEKDIVFQIGECFRKLGELNKAVSKFKEAISLDTLNAVYYAQLGYAYYSLGRNDSSVVAYKKATALDFDNAQYYRNLAMAYQKMDSIQGVVQSYQRAAQVLHPENISYVYNDLAAFYFGKGLWRDAALAYRRVIDFNPDNEMAYFWLGNAYEQTQDRKSAISALEIFLKRIEGDDSKSGYRSEVKHHVEMLKKKQE